MTENRIKAFLAEPMTAGPPRDWFVVSGHFFGFAVSRAVARAIDRQLSRDPPPEWIVFRDIVGSRVRLRTSLVQRLVESTAAQRAADRAFDKARQKEEEDDDSSDKRWND